MFVLLAKSREEEDVEDGIGVTGWNNKDSHVHGTSSMLLTWY